MPDSRSTFHQELDEIRRDLVRAGRPRHRGDPARHRGAARPLDLAAAQALIDGDDEIDVLTLDIEERCFTILARQQPMASDMRAHRDRDPADVRDRALRRPDGQRRQGDPPPLRRRRSRCRCAASSSAWPRRPSASTAWPSTPTPRATPSLAAALDDMDDRLDQLHKDYIQAIFELARRRPRRAGRPCSSPSSAATTSGSATTPSTSASGCSTWSRAGCPSTPAPPGSPPGRPADEPGGRRVTAVLAVLVVGAGRRRWSWCSSGQQRLARRLRGRRPSPVRRRRARAASGLAEATSVVERVVDRTLLRGGEGSVGRGPPGQRPGRDPAGRGRVRRRRGHRVSQRGRRRVPRGPPRRGARRGGHRRAGRGGAGQAGGAVPARTVDLFGPPRRTLVLTAMPPRAGRRAAWACSSSSTTSPSAAASRPCAATSSPTSATSSRRPSAPSACWPRRSLGRGRPRRRPAAGRADAHRGVPGRPHHRRPPRARRGSRPTRRPRREEVPVHRFIAEAVDRVRPAAEQQGISIEVEEPAARLAVAGDRRQLVSAIYNLLENAVKYSDAGSTVQVRARTDGRWVDIEVQDHGIGIPRARPRAGVRALLPGRPGPQPRDRRHRPRSRHRAPRRQQPRRRGQGRRRPRARAPRSPCDCRWEPGRSPSPQRQAERPMSTPDATVLVVEDEDSFVEALTVGPEAGGVPRARSPATAPRRSTSSTRCSPTSCCST